MYTQCQKARPQLEQLEDRTLLAICHVTDLGDQGAGQDLNGDLRYCINKVNVEPGADVIDFKVTGTIKLLTPLPRLLFQMDILGPGARLLTIDAQQKSRVFYVEYRASVTISGLTLTGGVTENKEPGGAIYNKGDLTLESCSVWNNKAGHYGGGIYNRGHLSVTDCTISKNTIDRAASNGTWGGGIYNASGATLLVRNSVISDNRNQPSYSANAFGAGIANLGRAVFMASTISGNVAHPSNIATIGGRGGGIYNGGELLVHDSLISMNIASGDWFGYGGGICNGSEYAPGGPITVHNSTIAYNRALVTGFDNSENPRGGGISSENGGSLTITHSTIAGNYSGWGLPGYGGGISTNSSTYLTMGNTILATNTANNGPDLWGSVSASGYNLFGKTSGGSGYSPTDLVNADPQLGPLANHGGPTMTMRLGPNSPAIDAGDPNPADPPSWDQRGPGFPRIANGRIDIGAFEVQDTPIPTSSRGSVNFAVLLTAENDDTVFA